MVAAQGDRVSLIAANINPTNNERDAMFLSRSSIAGRRARMNENYRSAEKQLDTFAVGAGPSRYNRRYGQRYEKYGVGAAANMDYVPPGNGNGRGCNWSDSGIDAGHGRVTDRVPVTGCKPTPPRCDCHVIGSNTLGTTGALSNGLDTLTLDSGDADFFIPYYMSIAAFELHTTTSTLIINPGTPLMVLMIDSKSGQEPNMRRASSTDQTFGVWSLIYGFEKEIECVDWRKFGSQTNQNLTLTFFNPNTVAVHIFVNLWGIAGISSEIA